MATVVSWLVVLGRSRQWEHRESSLLCQSESCERLGFAFDYIIEAVVPSIAFGVVDESVGETFFALLIREDKRKFIFFGDRDPNRLHSQPAIYIQPHAGVLLNLVIPADKHRGVIIWFPFFILVS